MKDNDLQQDNNNDQKSVAWFKQKWPWLILSLPLITVIAGVITYNIAANKPSSLVNDDYFKQGLAINKSLEKLNLAKALGLSAELKFDNDSQLISVKLNQKNPPTQTSDHLILTFSHPTQEKEDLIIHLAQLTPNEFVAEIPKIKQANWYIQLNDNNNAWQLKSRWLYPQKDTLFISPLNI